MRMSALAGDDIGRIFIVGRKRGEIVGGKRWEFCARFGTQDSTPSAAFASYQVSFWAFPIRVEYEGQDGRKGDVHERF